jgi:NAD(P)-dependent dehydrogenase (short-subunit alcohol dehydrogenase family)
MRVLVTGAARGLGRAFADALRERGDDVLGVDITDGAACDVTNEADCEAAVARAVRELGGLDALVNNAGIVAVTRGPCREIPSDEWDRVMAVNAKGAWLMTRAAIPALSRGGAIVNLASETAYSGSHGMSHYVASKAAVIGLTRALARELGPAGIRVNAIAPGYTDTEGGRAIGDPDAYDVSPTPLGRVAQPGDMVGTLLYLLDPASAFVTGQVVLVNGGRVM